MIYLSLCIPTNGISEWVFPVLESIFRQDVDLTLFEVIVTNNGDNEEFHEKMREYVSKHTNLIYKKTEAYLFENQIEALKLAQGEFLKFLKHRSILEPNSLIWLINIVKTYMEQKPIIYLSNGVLGYRTMQEYKNFDGFVRGLKHYASWTTGVGVWRSDFKRIPPNWVYNKISPHSDVLFFERHRDKYIIDDKIWCHDIDSSHKNKGRYDLYKAFGVEEIAITLGLFLDGDISSKTLKIVIKSYKNFVAFCYLQFNILRSPCSYKLDGFNEVLGIFMSKTEIVFIALIYMFFICTKKILKFLETHILRWKF